MASSSTEPVLQSRRSLYVGGLADEVNETNLRATMIPFGPLKAVDIVSDIIACFALELVFFSTRIVSFYYKTHLNNT